MITQTLALKNPAKIKAGSALTTLIDTRYAWTRNLGSR